MSLEKIGVGSTCNVYRADDGVVLKVSPTDKFYIEEEEYRMVVRFDDFCKKYPEHFTRLVSLRIEEGWPQDDFDFKDSKYVIVYSYVPLLEQNLLFHVETELRLRNEEVVAAYASFLHCYMLMWEEGWLHPDFHIGNFMYHRTALPTSTIQVDSKSYRLPSFNRQWYAIDYDKIYHNSAKGNKMPVHEFIAENRHYFLIHFFYQILYRRPPPDRDSIGVNIMMEQMHAHPRTSYLSGLLPTLKELATLRISFEILILLFERDMYHELFKGDIIHEVDEEMKEFIVYVIQHIDSPHSILHYIEKLLRHD